MFIRFVFLWAFSASLWAATVEDNIRHLHERLFLGEVVAVAGQPILAEGILPLFYEQRDYKPAWNDKDYALEVLELIRQSDQEGLYKEDYHYDALARLAGQLSTDSGNPYLRAQFDMLLTDGLLIYAHHLLNGKVDATEVVTTWNYDFAQLLPEDVIASLSRHVENESVAAGLADLKNKVPFYDLLKKALVDFTALADQKVFRNIPSDKTLRPDEQSDAIPLLRSRLFDLGFLTADSGASLYDDELVAAVKSFQSLYGLDSDGVVGPASFAQLNVPYKERADQLRINMDRIRWVSTNLAEDFIVVNIAGYELRLIRGGKPQWRTDVMIGKVSTKTPIFKSQLSYLVFNPTWTAPRSIIVKSLIPKMKADPMYAVNKNYQLIGRDGVAVDPLSLDWTKLSTNNFPYTVVQLPGKNNAMGQVKFMFPNQYAIYLHDTPSRYLFSQSQRAFSFGCIRVKDPMTLARLVLNDEQRWSDADIAVTVEGRELKHVSLAEPIDILLMYWTVKINDNGDVGFVKDIYERDPDLKIAFNRPLF